MAILDFPGLVRNEFDLDAAEYWNIPFTNKIRDKNFVKEINLKTDDNGLKNTLMLVDLIDIKIDHLGVSFNGNSNKVSRK